MKKQAIKRDLSVAKATCISLVLLFGIPFFFVWVYETQRYNNIEILEWNFEDSRIKGIVRNNNNNQIYRLRVIYLCYDRDGYQMTNAGTSFENLQAHTNWKFNASTYDDVDSVVLVGIALPNSVFYGYNNYY